MSLTVQQRAWFDELYRLHAGMPEAQQTIVSVKTHIDENGFLPARLAEKWKWEELVDEAVDFFGDEWRDQLAFVQTDNAGALANQAARFAKDPAKIALPRRIENPQDAVRGIAHLSTQDRFFRPLSAAIGGVKITVESLPEGTLGLAERPPANIRNPHRHRAKFIKLAPGTTLAVAVHEAAHAMSEADIHSSSHILPNYKKVDPFRMSLAELYDALLENSLLEESFATQFELAAIRILPDEMLDDDAMTLKSLFEQITNLDSQRPELMEWMEMHPGYYSYRLAALAQALMLKAGMTDDIPSIEDMASLAGFGNPKEQRVLINADRLKAFIKDNILKHLGSNGIEPQKMIAQMATSRLLELAPRIMSLLNGEMPNDEVLEFLRGDLREFIGVASNMLDSVRNSAEFKKVLEVRTLQPRSLPMQKGAPKMIEERPETAAYAAEIMSKYTEFLAASAVAGYDFDETGSGEEQGRELWRELLRYAVTATPESGARAFEVALAVKEKLKKEMPVTEKARLARALSDSGYKQLGRELIHEILDDIGAGGEAPADLDEAIRKRLMHEFELEKMRPSSGSFDRYHARIAGRVLDIMGVHAAERDEDIARFAVHLAGRHKTDKDHYGEGAVLLAILSSGLSTEMLANMPKTKAFFDGLLKEDRSIIRKFTAVMKIDTGGLNKESDETDLNKESIKAIGSFELSQANAHLVAQIFLELKGPKKRGEFLTYHDEYDRTVTMHPTAFWAGISRAGEDIELTRVAFEEAKKDWTPAANIILSDMAEHLLDYIAGERGTVARDILERLDIPAKIDGNILNRRRTEADGGSYGRLHMDHFPERIDKALRHILAYAIAVGDKALVAEVGKRHGELVKIKYTPPLTDEYIRDIYPTDNKLGGWDRVRIDQKGQAFFYNLFIDEISRLVGNPSEREWQLGQIETDVAMQRHSVNVQHFLEMVAAIERTRQNGDLEPVIVRLGRALIDQTIQEAGGNATASRNLFALIDSLPIPAGSRDDLLALFVERAMPRVHLGRSDEASEGPAFDALQVAIGIFKKRALYPKGERAAIQRVAEATRNLSLSSSSKINTTILRLLGGIWQIYADDAHLGRVKNIDTFGPSGQVQSEADIRNAYESGHIAPNAAAIRSLVSDDLNRRLASGLVDQIRSIVLGRLPERSDLNASFAEKIFNDWKAAVEGGNTTMADVLFPLWAVGATRGEARHRMPLLLEALALDLPNNTARKLTREAFRSGEYGAGYIEAYERVVESGDDDKESLLQRLAIPVSIRENLKFPGALMAAYIMDRPVVEGKTLAESYDRRRGGKASAAMDILVAYLFQGKEAWLIALFVDLSLMAHELRIGDKFEVRERSGISPIRHKPILDPIIQSAGAVGHEFKDAVEKRLKEVFKLGWATPLQWRHLDLAQIEGHLASFSRILRDTKRLDDISQDLQLEKIAHLKGADWLKNFLVRRFLAQLSSGARQAIALEMEGKAESDATRIFFERTGLEKIGQFLSTWPQVPEEIREELSGLQANVAQTPLGIVRWQIAMAFEGHPEQASILANLDPTPLGSGTIGEVYKSRLKDGTPVAVKVIPETKEEKFRDALQKLNEVRNRLRLYEGEREGISEALSLIDLYLGIVEDELDLGEERANQAMGSGSLPKGVATPRFLDGMVRQKVAVMEFVEGVPLSKVRDEGARSRLAERIREAFFGAVAGGFYHSDLQPGNFIYNSEKDLVYILDWGQVGQLTGDEFANVAELLGGLAAGDVNAVADVVEKMGWQREHYNRPSFKERVGTLAAGAQVLQMATGPVFGVFNAAASTGLQIAMPYLHLLKGAASVETAINSLMNGRNGGGQLPPDFDGGAGMTGEQAGGELAGEGMGMEGMGAGMDTGGAMYVDPAMTGMPFMLPVRPVMR